MSSRKTPTNNPTATATTIAAETDTTASTPTLTEDTPTPAADAPAAEGKAAKPRRRKPAKPAKAGKSNAGKGKGKPSTPAATEAAELVSSPIDTTPPSPALVAEPAEEAPAPVVPAEEVPAATERAEEAPVTAPAEPVSTTPDQVAASPVPAASPTPAPVSKVPGLLQLLMRNPTILQDLIVEEAKRVFGVEFTREGSRAYVEVDALLEALGARVSDADLLQALADRYTAHPIDTVPPASLPTPPAVPATSAAPVALTLPAIDPAPLPVDAVKVPPAKPATRSQPPAKSTPARPSGKASKASAEDMPAALAALGAGPPADLARRLFDVLRKAGKPMQPVDVRQALGLDAGYKSADTTKAKRAADLLKSCGLLIVTGTAHNVRWTARELP